MRVLTHDGPYPYRGLSAPGGICRVRLYEAAGETPVLLITELDEPGTTPMTCVAEFLAAELMVRHLRHRLEELKPAIIVEHYPPRESRARPGYGRLVFTRWAPRVV